jgi:hypothetical protein
VKSNPPINVLPEKTLREVERGERKVQLIYRDKLAERLGVSPKERLSLTLVEHGEPIGGKVLLLVSALLDGGDLTPGQETIFRAYLQEVGVETLGIVPEMPVTS